MSLQRAFAIAVAVSLWIGSAGSAPAQQIQDEADSGGVTGQVVRVSASDNTITVDGPNDDGGIYWVDPKASVMNGAKNIKITDIKPGWTVTVTYQKPDVKMVATYIEVVDAPN